VACSAIKKCWSVVVVSFLAMGFQAAWQLMWSLALIGAVLPTQTYRITQVRAPRVCVCVFVCECVCVCVCVCSLLARQPACARVHVHNAAAVHPETTARRPRPAP
jgi:hypothetical protein